MRTGLAAFCFALIIGLKPNDATAQGRFKGGLGYSFISNNFDDQYLGDYFAPSFHLSYALVRSPRFSLDLESGTALKAKQSGDRERIIFLSSLPLVGQYGGQKVGVHAGAGPAYLTQKDKTFQQNNAYSGFFLQALTGVSYKAKPIIGGFLIPEFQARLSFLKNIRNSSRDAGTLSLIVFLRSR